MIRPYELWAEQNLTIVTRNSGVSGDEFKIQCLNPNHDDTHPSAYFNVEKGSWFCHSCGARGSVADNPELSSLEFQSNTIKNRLNKAMNPVESKSTSYASEMTLARFRLPTTYWDERGLSKDIQELFELGYDAIANAVTIPTRDITGALIGVTRRFVATDHVGSRYKYPKGFKASQNLFASWLYDEYDMSTISVHEGAIDAMRLWQLGIPATALYGSNISPYHIELLLQMGVRRVVYFGDSDNAGQRAKQRSKGFWIKPDDTYVYKKDTDLSKQFLLSHVTDYNGKKDAGAMTDEEILKSWSSQEPYTFHGNTRKRVNRVDIRTRLGVK